MFGDTVESQTVPPEATDHRQGVRDILCPYLIGPRIERIELMTEIGLHPIAAP
jgi:hypothetical protein